MSRMKIMGLVGLVFTLALAITENAEAQHRERGRRSRHGRVVVVTRRPAHRVVVRRAHVRYVGMPRWGAVVTAAPAGAVVIQGRNPYYYHSGVYYVRRGPGFAVVRPVPGVRIRVLPIGYRTVVVGPRNYYYYYGTFYAKADSSDEYVVADAPEGAVVDALPEGCDIKNVGDAEYYVLDGIYYAEVDAPEFEDGVGYQVVKV